MIDPSFPSQSVTEAEQALCSKPLHATSVERFLIYDEIKSLHRDLPQPLRLSYQLSTLLDRVSVPLMPYDLIAGRCVDRELTQEEEERFQAYLASPDYPHRNVIFNAGHCPFDWEALVTKGLEGLRRDASLRLDTVTDPDQHSFLTGMLEIYDAFVRYLGRYADAADRMHDAALSRSLRLAATRPTDFRSALQLLWTVTLVTCAYVTPNPTLTLGRLDQLLLPFYRKDLADGTLTRAQAAALITDYYAKHNLIMGRGEHQVGDTHNSTTFERIYNFDAPQYLLLAGTHDDGTCAVNELTELFAECIVPSFKNPVVVVRYPEGMDKTHPSLWRTLCDKALQSASLMFYHDGRVRATLTQTGIPYPVTNEYAHFGCNWCGMGRIGSWMHNGPYATQFGTATEEERAVINVPLVRYFGKRGWPFEVEAIVEALAQEKADFTIDDVYDRLTERFEAYVDLRFRRLSTDLLARRRRPAAVLTLTDCFLTESIRNAACHAACATYHYEELPFQMFGTTVDCLCVVDQLVLTERKLTVAELLAAVRADFVGHGHTLALCRNADKFGQDTPRSNAHVKRLSEMIARVVRRKNEPYLASLGLFVMPALQSDTWHLKYGEDRPASIDGRRANTPFSQNSNPTAGVCKNGLTATLNAMLCIPYDGFTSGAFNLDVDPKQFEGESGRRTFAALLAAYFNRGGLHAQVSAVSRDDLIDAQRHPDRHRDLRVRITGYSGVFVDVCKRLQDDIIKRFS